MEFAHLAPAEAANIEDLLQQVHGTFGSCDLERAWDRMDLSRQNWLTEKDFIEGLKRLGFQGNVKLLFHGLDNYGLRRVNRADFLYLARVASHSHQRKAEVRHPVIRALLEWVHTEQGGIENFLRKLGLPPKDSSQPTDASDRLSSREFADMLYAFGFGGDAREAANQAARYEGGSHGGTAVTSDSLTRFLEGSRHKAAGGEQAGTPTHGSRPSSPSGARSSRPGGSRAHQKWNDTLCDFSTWNGAQTACTKFAAWQNGEVESYPESVEKDRRATSRAASRSASPSGQRFSRDLIGMPRPAWDGSPDMKSALNAKLPASSRQYFNDDRLRPPTRRKEAAMPQDGPGIYLMTKNTKVLDSDELTGRIIASVKKGDKVEILEIRRREDLNRVRAQLRHPPGWISLVVTDKGIRSAERVSDEKTLKRARRAWNMLKASFYTRGGVDLEKLFLKADRDGGGDIEWSEFERMCKLACVPDEEGDLRVFFNVIDKDNSGQVTLQELYEFAEFMNRSCEPLRPSRQSDHTASLKDTLKKGAPKRRPKGSPGASTSTLGSPSNSPRGSDGGLPAGAQEARDGASSSGRSSPRSSPRNDDRSPGRSRRRDASTTSQRPAQRAAPPRSDPRRGAPNHGRTTGSKSTGARVR